LAENSVRIRSLRARLRQVTKATRAGTPLSEALRDNDAITATGCDLVAVGEKTGRMPEMLRSLARLYQNSGRERAKRALQLIEPVAILIIGGAIGVIITGVVLAITASQELGM
jgi:general secretion pathway protein F